MNTVDNLTLSGLPTVRKYLNEHDTFTHKLYTATGAKCYDDAYVPVAARLEQPEGGDNARYIGKPKVYTYIQKL